MDIIILIIILSYNRLQFPSWAEEAHLIPEIFSERTIAFFGNSGGSSVEHWGGPFSLQRVWLSENFPEYFYFYTSTILINNFNNESSVDVDVDVECPYITEDSYYIAGNNCRA